MTALPNYSVVDNNKHAQISINDQNIYSDCNNQASAVKHYQRQLCLIIQLFTIINMHRSQGVKGRGE